jgi:hypothetical protein
MEFASGYSCAQAARWRPRCQNQIYGKSACSFDENGQSQRDSKQMKFISFAWLITAPIHKEANPAVYHQDGYRTNPAPFARRERKTQSPKSPELLQWWRSSAVSTSL